MFDYPLSITILLFVIGTLGPTVISVVGVCLTIEITSEKHEEGRAEVDAAVYGFLARLLMPIYAAGSKKSWKEGDQ